MPSSRSPDQLTALAEDRRIYLGNLFYIFQPVEIEETLEDNGFLNYRRIHISMDPGYCLVDLPDRADAEGALSSLDTSIRGRTLKLGLCELKKQQASQWRSQKKPDFNIWVKLVRTKRPGWRGLGRQRVFSLGMIDKRGIEHGPYGVIEQFEDVAATGTDGRRLYIGGLAKMVGQ
ncbi:RNA recognition domain-containing protein [Colletotrichum incanum]|nr:RNA recognition domain-containing protein [Colletotrichum incanum]